MKRLLLAMFLALSGCASLPISPVDTSLGSEYRLGPGDRVRITTFREETLTGEFTVGDDGTVAFPLIGNIDAKGKTTNELTAALTIELGTRFLRNPRVNVDIITYRPVYILGEVTKPGEFPYVANMTVLGLVAKAGGFSYRAQQKYVFVRHEGEEAEKRYELGASLRVRPGDTLRVGARYF